MNGIFCKAKRYSMPMRNSCQFMIFSCSSSFAQYAAAFRLAFRTRRFMSRTGSGNALLTSHNVAVSRCCKNSGTVVYYLVLLNVMNLFLYSNFNHEQGQPIITDSAGKPLLHILHCSCFQWRMNRRALS